MVPIWKESAFILLSRNDLKFDNIVIYWIAFRLETFEILVSISSKTNV